MKLIFENSSEDFDRYKQLALELNFEIVDVKKIDEIKSICDKGPNASLRNSQIKQIFND